jgi:hypothetical protein
VFPVPWSSKWSWSLHLFLGRPMFLRPFGLYCSACFGNLFVSILCTCFSQFFWYCFIRKILKMKKRPTQNFVFDKFPEDGIFMLKHVGIGIWYEVCCNLFYFSLFYFILL